MSSISSIARRQVGFGNRIAPSIESRKDEAMKAIKIAIHSFPDIITARQQGRALAARFGCNGTNLTLISTLISEVARKVAEHPLPGEMLMSISRDAEKLTLTLVVRVHHSDKTAGVEVPLDFGSINGFEVTCRPDQTILKLVQPLEMDQIPASNSP
jgi:hypothetical protein